MVHAAVVGARGYLGRELMRWLLAHPRVDALTPITQGKPGTRYGDSVPAFRHRTDLRLQGLEAARDADVVFLATDAEEARRHVEPLADAPLIVDLSRAHRAEALANQGGWTYGLSEFFPVAKGARRIANPGCYPTATLLAAAPALRAGLAGPGPLISDGKSGISGAGATPREDLHYPEAHDAVRAYRVLNHDHAHEIHAAAANLEGHASPASHGTNRGASPARPVRFTPHLVPMNRGLLATVYLPVTATPEVVQAAYEAAYAQTPFVRLVAEPDTAHVRGSNFADVAVDVDASSGLLVARCAIDNLVKGGSGAAIQNMNLALGWPATLGLDRVAGGP